MQKNQNPPTRRQRAAQRQALVRQGPVAQAGGKSFLAAAALAPVLLPMVTQAVTSVIGAIRGNQSGNSLVVRDRQSKINSVVKSGGFPQTPGSNKIDPIRVGIRRTPISNTACRITMADEVGTAGFAAGVGTWWSTCQGFATVGQGFVSPANSSLHPVNYFEGYQWQDFQVDSIRMSYIPTAGDAQGGSLIMGYVDNPNNAAATDMVGSEIKAASLAQDGLSLLFPANQSATLNIPRQRSWKTERNIAASAVVDPDDITPGCVFISSTGISAGAVTTGRWLVEVTYVVYNRRAAYAGSGLVLEAQHLCMTASNEQQRSVARAKLLKALQFISSDCMKLLSRSLDDSPQGMSDTDFRTELSRLIPPPRSKTPTAGY